jgi:hypothetical protein
MADLVITITGEGKSAAYTPNAYLVVNNSMVISAQTTTVSPGSIIECSAKKGSNGVARIVLDGTVVAESTASSTSAKYTLTANRNYTINLSVGTDAIITITSGIDPNDPMSPHDGHNTNVDSVAREIEGGTVNIGGVEHEIECGFVLVGGVSREIPFGPQTANVTITGSGAGRAWVTIDGKKYTGAATVEVPKGTALVASCTAATAIETYITLNGKTVKTGSGTIAYSMTVEEDTAVKLIGSEKVAGTYYRGRVEITTG